MNKNIEKRQFEVKEIVNNPIQGIAKLEEKVKALYKCRNTTQLIEGLSELYHLSVPTLWRDLE